MLQHITIVPILFEILKEIDQALITILNLLSWNSRIPICIAIGVWLGSCRSVGIVRSSNSRLLSVRKVIMPPPTSTLGSALAVKERFDEACESLRRGVALDDSCNDAKFNLGLTLLRLENLKRDGIFMTLVFACPTKCVLRLMRRCGMETSKILQVSHLLVWAEQGYGDNIQFVRYVQILIEAGVKVTLSARKPLMRLFKECLQPHDPVIVEHKFDQLQHFQHHVALLSLPRLCGTTRETVPMMPGFLRRPVQIPERLENSAPTFCFAYWFGLGFRCR